MDCFYFHTDNKDFRIYRFVCPYLASNMYAILSGDKAIVFDPCEDNELVYLFERNNIRIVHILLTHEHYDHISGVVWLQACMKTDLFCQKEAAKALAIGRTRRPALISTVLANEDKKDGGHRYPEFKAHFKPYKIKADSTFDLEFFYPIDDLSFHVISTPGHSPGSSCYILNNDIMFTGDTLLQNDPVIIRFSTSSKELYEDVTLPFLRKQKRSMIIMPGHGDPFILKDTKNI